MIERFIYEFSGAELKELMREDPRRYFINKESRNTQLKYTKTVKRSRPLCRLQDLLVLEEPLLALEDDALYEVEFTTIGVRLSKRSSLLILRDLSQQDGDRVH